MIERGTARIGAALVIAGLALSGCGGSDGGSSNSKATAAGVSLTPPQGWQVQNNGDRGLVLAPADSPAGPQFTARPASGEAPEPKALVRSLSSSQGARVYTQPSRVRIDGHGGVAIAVRKRQDGLAIISGLVAVPLGPGRAYTFLLEAPARQWAASKATLNRILYSAEFDVAAVPQA